MLSVKIELLVAKCFAVSKLYVLMSSRWRVDYMLSFARVSSTGRIPAVLTDQEISLNFGSSAAHYDSTIGSTSEVEPW
jgi:hypothetical protein